MKVEVNPITAVSLNIENKLMSPIELLDIVEDLDAVFEGRENIAVKKGLENGLTFDSFLNSIDGVENTDGVFIIITTNDVKRLDPALGVPRNGGTISTRPGRIDRTLKFENLTEKGREKMATRILGDFERVKWEYLLVEGNDDTGAQFQERCSRVALNLFWETKERRDVGIEVE